MDSDLTHIGLVCVCYRSMAVLPDMLSSVPESVRIVLVSNDGENDAALTQLASDRGAELIRNSENVGFGTACNQGAAALDTEFVLFLNPDARLDKAALPALIEAAGAHPEAAAFVPNVRDGQGRAAFRRRSRLLPRSAHWRGSAPKTETEVSLLNGAAIFVPRRNFQVIGGFDESIFLYHEDDDLALRLRATCGPLIYVPDAVVRHMEGHSTARSPAVAAFKAYHMAQSALYAMTKHNRRFARARLLGHAALQLLSPVNLISARKRAKNIGFFKGCIRPTAARQ